jgi:hypothetical protein
MGNVVGAKKGGSGPQPLNEPTVVLSVVKRNARWSN